MRKTSIEVLQDERPPSLREQNCFVSNNFLKGSFYRQIEFWSRFPRKLINSIVERRKFYGAIMLLAGVAWLSASLGFQPELLLKADRLEAAPSVTAAVGSPGSAVLSRFGPDNPDRASAVIDSGQAQDFSQAPASVGSIPLVPEGEQIAPSAYLTEEIVQAGTLAIPGFNEQVEQWISALVQEPEFQSWQGAQREVLPLGPGLHGWVVLLSKADQQVGYLVVGAVEDGGYRLLEYGTGSKPLYSMDTLYQSMVQQGLIDSSIISKEGFAMGEEIGIEPVYSNGLQAIWRIRLDGEVIAVDAKSGEFLPPSVLENLDPLVALESEAAAGQKAEELTNDRLGTGNRLLASCSKPWSDPMAYAYWMKPGASVLAPGTLPDWTETIGQTEDITYVSKLFGGGVISPYSVSGYHLWDDGLDGDKLYVSLDQDGTRYFPLSLLTTIGEFYPTP